ncbi:hypothetical protein GJ496_010595 [Pomphorhynchus laevis]|nr:hypothetical protein GJ496_010595 [Pomphorhynchus laevis]
MYRIGKVLAVGTKFTSFLNMFFHGLYMNAYLHIRTCDPGKNSNSGKHNELTEYNNELVSDSQSIEHIRFPSKRLKKKPSYLKDYVTEEY